MAENTMKEVLAKYKIIPVLVLNDLESGMERCRLLCENFLPVAEITFRTEAAESIIRQVSKELPQMFVGAGTILNVNDLHRAFDAGAKFAVAPGFNPVVVKEGRTDSSRQAGARSVPVPPDRSPAPSAGGHD